MSMDNFCLLSFIKTVGVVILSFNNDLCGSMFT